MSAEETKTFLELGPARRARARGLSIKLPLAERLRAARGFPQAIVKVTSFSHGLHQVSRQLRYISRNGNLPLEKSDGELLMDRKGQKQLLGEWAPEFDRSPRSRDTASIVFSLPPGSDVNALHKAVRTTATKSFAGHEWLFAVHEDRHHPHAHLIVKMRGGAKGEKLRLRKGDLYRLRQTFAEASREQGVKVAASPRAARGVTHKAARQPLFHMRERGITPRVDAAAHRENLSGETRKPAAIKPWEKAIAERQAMEQQLYLRHASWLRERAAQKTGSEQARWIKAASDLEKFAQKLTPTKSRDLEPDQAAPQRQTNSTSGQSTKRSEGLELG